MRREYIDSMAHLHATWLSHLLQRLHRQQQHWVKTEHSIQRNSAQRAPMAEDERKAESI